ncbi:MAG: glycosyltransferase [Actinomycetota bacterium]
MPGTENDSGTHGALPAHDAELRGLADRIVAGEISPASFDGGDEPLDLRLATHLARSKHAAETAAWPGSIAIVFAMWGERRRLAPRSGNNPTGEDALHAKLDQLGWLFDGTPTTWSVYAVDDGDPEDSAIVAEERAALHSRGERVSVLRLGDAIPARDGPLRTLTDVDESRKGGAIVLGAATALTNGADAIVMTDADNSVNLGQVGALVAEHAAGTPVVVGDRKHPESVLVKAEARWGPGIVVLRHMQRMVGRALFDSGLRDTQAAFKLYGRAPLVDILAAPSTFGFAFDSDWLYASLRHGHRIERVPFGFVDSFEESASITQGPMTTWESLLQGLVFAARARDVSHDKDMADVVDRFGHADVLEQVINAVPPELAGVADSQLGDPKVMTPAQLAAWLESIVTR